MRDAEFEIKRQVKDYEAMLGDLRIQVEKSDREQERLHKMLDDKDAIVNDLRKIEKQLKSAVKKGESDLKKLEKKASGYKKYIKKVEETIIQKDEKLKFLEMFKKNSDLCSLVESAAPRNDLEGL